jgi:hypothetical protein
MKSGSACHLLPIYTVLGTSNSLAYAAFAGSQCPEKPTRSDSVQRSVETQVSVQQSPRSSIQEEISMCNNWNSNSGQYHSDQTRRKLMLRLYRRGLGGRDCAVPMRAQPCSSHPSRLAEYRLPQVTQAWCSCSQPPVRQNYYQRYLLVKLN